MTKDDLEQRTKARPIVPVRLHLSNGTARDLTHPDSILVSETVAALAIGGHITLVALNHINENTTLPTVKA